MIHQCWKTRFLRFRLKFRRIICERIPETYHKQELEFCSGFKDVPLFPLRSWSLPLVSRLSRITPQKRSKSQFRLGDLYPPRETHSSIRFESSYSFLISFQIDFVQAAAILSFPVQLLSSKEKRHLANRFNSICTQHDGAVTQRTTCTRHLSKLEFGTENSQSNLRLQLYRHNYTKNYIHI